MLARTMNLIPICLQVSDEPQDSLEENSKTTEDLVERGINTGKEGVKNWQSLARVDDASQSGGDVLRHMRRET
jgi:hypothetical protein